MLWQCGLGKHAKFSDRADDIFSSAVAIATALPRGIRMQRKSGGELDKVIECIVIDNHSAVDALRLNDPATAIKILARQLKEVRRLSLLLAQPK